jgi:hypothetical protein
VVVPRGQTRPSDLLEGLVQRDVEIHIVADLADVMVDLAYHGSQAVIIKDPSSVPRISELLAAIRCYYPRTAVWRYDSPQGQLKGRLSSFYPVAEAQKSIGTQAVVNHQAAAESEPPGSYNSALDYPSQASSPIKNQSVKEEVIETESVVKAKNAGLPPLHETLNPVITTEELEMLLGRETGSEAH